MTTHTPRLLGAMLAGGAARRFGADKAQADWHGRPLIAHALDQLAPHVQARAVCGRSYADLPSLADHPAPGLGPLGGLLAALRHAQAHGYDAVLTIACDTPVVPTALFPALIAQRPAWCRDAPVLGCWPASLAERLAAFLAHDRRRSIRGWAQSVDATGLASPHPIANINTPGDLAAL